MTDRPYILLSCSMSLDGFLSGPTDERLLLSCAADFDRVDAVRATCDAILVGAATVRRDNPRLLVRAAERRAERLARDLPSSPVKVTMTGTARLDRNAQFFTAGEGEKLVYCAGSAVDEAMAQLGDVATIIDGGQPVDIERLAKDLSGRGIRRLMVEGGQRVLTQFLTAGLADEMHLVVAPFFVGDSRARRFVGDGAFPWHADHRADLAEVRRVDDVVLLRYALSDRFGTAEGPG